MTHPAIARVQKAAADYEQAQAQAQANVELARQRFEGELRAAVEAGVSQSELARALGVSRQAIHKRLRGSG